MASGRMDSITADQIDVLNKEALDNRLTNLVKTHLGDRQPIRILDAGCGRMWSWDLQGMEYHLTGVDEDAEALRLRVEQKGDLDDFVVADLTTMAIEPESYDLVHSAYVLEHVHGAEEALSRMLAALRRGGLLVLKIPDGSSMYGLLARRTPHSMHVAYKRHVRKKPLAGTPGHGPYPVVYDKVVSRPGILNWGRANGLELLMVAGDNGHLEFFGPVAPAVDLGLRGIAACTFGRITAKYSNLVLAFRKM